MKIDNEYMKSIRKKVDELKDKFEKTNLCSIDFTFSTGSNSPKIEFDIWYYVSNHHHLSRHLNTFQGLEEYHKKVMSMEVADA